MFRLSYLLIPEGIHSIEDFVCEFTGNSPQVLLCSSLTINGDYTCYDKSEEEGTFLHVLLEESKEKRWEKLIDYLYTEAWQAISNKPASLDKASFYRNVWRGYLYYRFFVIVDAIYELHKIHAVSKETCPNITNNPTVFLYEEILKHKNCNEEYSIFLRDADASTPWYMQDATDGKTPYAIAVLKTYEG